MLYAEIIYAAGRTVKEKIVPHRGWARLCRAEKLFSEKKYQNSQMRPIELTGPYIFDKCAHMR